MTRLAILILAVAACGDNNTSGDPLVNAQIDEGTARGQDLANMLDIELTGNDPITIMGKAADIMAAINTGEIDEASIAVSVAAVPVVRDFANRMAVEHTDLNSRLDAVRRDLALPAIPNAVSSALQMEASDSLASLRRTPPASFDLAYMQIQVMDHAEAQVLLDRLATSIPANTEFDMFVADMRAAVDDHLLSAETILHNF